jgi:ribosomal protein S21
MISVKSKGRNNQKLLTQFKSLVNAEGTLETYKSKRYYVKPSLKKKLKREAAQRQRMKDEIKLIRQIENEQKEWRS